MYNIQIQIKQLGFRKFFKNRPPEMYIYCVYISRGDYYLVEAFVNFIKIGVSVSKRGKNCKHANFFISAPPPTKKTSSGE